VAENIHQEYDYEPLSEGDMRFHYIDAGAVLDIGLI